MEEREKTNYLAMWDGKRGADRNPVNYQRRDDGSHVYTGKEDYFEWWYFDASFENGYHIVLTFHYSNVFLWPMIPTIQTMIYKPDGTQVAEYIACEPKDVFACPDYCDVRMNGAWARDNGAFYEVYMNIRGLGAHLTFKNSVPGWKAGTGFLYKNEEEGSVSGWCIPVPNAHVEGELFLKGETIKVEGSGYHDHNWGTYRFHQTFQNWYWGRIHDDKYTVVYGWVVPKDKDAPVVSPLLIARNDEIILSTNMMDIELEDFAVESKTGKEYAKKLTLISNVRGVNLSLLVNTHRVIEVMQLPKAVDWGQFYYRFLGDFEMNIEIDGEKDQVKNELLHELMIL